MNSEAIKPGFLYDDDWNRFPSPIEDLLPELRKTSE